MQAKISKRKGLSKMVIFFLILDNCYILLYIVYNSGGNMKIIISNSSVVPIYEQIKNAIISQIMNGDLEENESIPSIRSLAQDIRISVMTIKKAYDELEQEGYIVTRQGKGSFVAAKNKELVREQAKKDIESHIEKIIEISNKFDIEKEEILSLFQFLMESDKK